MTPSLRQILVHLDSTEASLRRLITARRLAQRHGAEISALYAVTPAFIELPYAPEVGPTAAAAVVEIDDRRREQMLDAFEREMALPGPIANWTQTDEVPTSPAFAQQALFADLLVLGQHDAADPAARSVPPDFVEEVLHASGRPAVVLPHVGWSGEMGDTIAIAWKETPEAARAVKAALPFLQRASRVHVFAWSEPGTPRLAGRPLDLLHYLGLHGVEAIWHHEGPEPRGLGELLLSRTYDVSADLLVMGCYGHSRAREWVLGGVSRTLLQAMTLPVLMAH